MLWWLVEAGTRPAQLDLHCIKNSELKRREQFVSEYKDFTKRWWRLWWLGLIGGIVPSPPDVPGSAERGPGKEKKEGKKGRDESGISRVEKQPGCSNPVLWEREAARHSETCDERASNLTPSDPGQVTRQPLGYFWPQSNSREVED